MFEATDHNINYINSKYPHKFYLKDKINTVMYVRDTSSLLFFIESGNMELYIYLSQILEILLSKKVKYLGPLAFSLNEIFSFL